MSALRGLLRIARFRSEGLIEFDASRNGFFGSLGPLVAFALVGAASMLMAGHWRAAAANFLASIVALIAPLLITEMFARKWGVQDRWLRFAVASNWSQCIVPVMFVVMSLVFSLLTQLDVFPDEEHPLIGSMFVLLLYAIALQWFLIRQGLDLSKWRTTLLLLLCDVTTGALVLLPTLAAVGFKPPG